MSSRWDQSFDLASGADVWVQCNGDARDSDVTARATELTPMAAQASVDELHGDRPSPTAVAQRLIEPEWTSPAVMTGRPA